MHIGEFRSECHHGVGQGIARLIVRGRNNKPTDILARELAGEPLQVFGFDKHAIDQLHRVFARARQPGQALALANKNLNAEFDLKFADLLAHARLGRVQGLRRLGQIEVVSHGLSDITELLEIHRTTLATAKKN